MSHPIDVLVIGGGGREHALCWKLLQSPRCGRLWVAPGNPGIAALGARVTCVATPAIDDQAGLIDFAQRQRIGLVVCGPEAPLVAGLGDVFAKTGIPFFGPSRAAAEIEGSKSFAKRLMAEAGIPTAAYGSFSSVEEAESFIDAQPGNVVVKADGLCAGKGVEVTSSHVEARGAVRRMLSERIFGESGARVVIEERLSGRECSMLALCDGTRFALLASSEDHKTIYEGDRGPNTGGMGACSPSPLVDDALAARIGEIVFAPVLRALSAVDRPFRGLLYAGLMLTPDRGPMVIEFNCRFGDPETQAVLVRMKDDLLPWLLGAAKGRLPEGQPRFSPGASVCVVLAAPGYPEKPRTGEPILGLPPVVEQDPERTVLLFHAGTREKDGRLFTAGGRVLGVTACGADLQAARTRVYAAIEKIDFPSKQYRKDIGLRGASLGFTDR